MRILDVGCRSGTITAGLAVGWFTVVNAEILCRAT